MKNVMVVVAVMVFCASCANGITKETPHNIVGNWDSHNAYEGKEYVLEARFKANGDYDAFDNGKPFVSGKYRTVGDTIYLKDGLCNMDYEGVYVLTYFKDSARFAVIEDTCTPRRNGSDGLGVKRIATAKK